MRVRTKAAEADRGSAPFRMWALIVLMLAAALFIVACQEEETEATTPAEEAESEGPAVGVTLVDITENPEEFVGNTVTVSADINDLLGPQAMTIGGEDFLGTDELLILGAGPLTEVVEGAEDKPEPDDIVQVTGTVGQFEVREAEEEIGTDLDEDLFAEYEDEPFIIADKILLTPRAEAASEDIQTPVEDITGNPEDFLGVNVTTSGQVSEVLEPTAFTIGDPGTEGDLAVEDALLIINQTQRAPDPNISERMVVQVSGEVREFDIATFEQDLGVGLDDQLYSPYEGQPALIAQQIQQTQGGGTTSQ